MSFSTDAHDPSARFAGTSPRDAWGGMNHQSRIAEAGASGLKPAEFAAKAGGREPWPMN